jgi:AcrR family transcriptional regulator
MTARAPTKPTRAANPAKSARTAKPARAKAGRPPKRLPDEKKRDATRRHLVERALALFQERGVERTTMRDVAKAAGMSLGAAYYYFPSKEALVFAFYEDNQAAAERVELHGSLRDQLGALLHAKLDSIHDQRHMLGTIVQRLVDPGDPLSAFSAHSRAIRERSIELFAKPLRDAGVPAESVGMAAHALWLFQLGIMLVYINDASPGQKRTHGLVDDALDMLVPLVPLLATPIGAGLVAKVTAALSRAGISLAEPDGT